ncbi:hypothetical protein FB475_3922 [Kribbella jejuensis]|uniref:Uncharacterized protein n=1 Tax=Kribbella jejuensis TaxID=236068 RepID=A0A542EWL5_9ACTN|nr:hypothetical protein FB475_3922 [Kribbella jejuensis]
MDTLVLHSIDVLYSPGLFVSTRRDLASTDPAERDQHASDERARHRDHTPSPMEGRHAGRPADDASQDWRRSSDPTRVTCITLLTLRHVTFMKQSTNPTALHPGSPPPPSTGSAPQPPDGPRRTEPDRSRRRHTTHRRTRPSQIPTTAAGASPPRQGSSAGRGQTPTVAAAHGRTCLAARADADRRGCRPRQPPHQTGSESPPFRAWTASARSPRSSTSPQPNEVAVRTRLSGCTHHRLLADSVRSHRPADPQHRSGQGVKPAHQTDLTD